MLKKLTERIVSWFRIRRRMYSIYCELGYVPWRKPAKARIRKKKDGTYLGGREIIPFMNDDAKRTISQLVFRPGYMMRDYVVKGDHEHYLAPITALLVFFSVFTLLLSILQPAQTEKGILQQIVDSSETEFSFSSDSTVTRADSLDLEARANKIGKAVREVVVLAHLDSYPEKADKPWKKSLAAFESNLRSKGVQMFLGNFLWLWLLLWVILRKKYHISFSGAAAISAYILCQLCVFKMLWLLVTFGKHYDPSLVFCAILLVIDYHQLLGVPYKKAIRLTAKTGLLYVLYLALLFLLIGLVASLFLFLPAK